MKQRKPHFNFVQASNWRKSNIDFLLIFLAVLFALILFAIYQFKLINYKQQLKKQASQPVILVKQVNPNLTAQLQRMHKTQSELNVPWMETLNAIEKVKLAHPSVQFLSIAPNLKRNEINIKLKAEEFSDVSALINTFRHTPRFGEAEIVSQEIERADDEAMMVFDLEIGWKI